jgi:hypothetical protein
MGLNSSQLSAWSIGQAGFTTGSRANFPINSAYVHLTSGAGYAVRFRAQSAGPLQEFYALLDATTGNRANVSLRGRLYQDNNAASSSRPSSNLIATANNASLPASDDRWVRWTFPTPPSLVLNENYWFVVDNLAAAPATDFPSLLTGFNFRTSNRATNTELLGSSFSSVNGFTTNGSGAGAFFVYVVDGLAYGNPFTAATNTPYTSNQLRHGALFASEFERFQYYSPQIDGIALATNLFEVHDANVSVGSGVLYSSSIPTGNADSTLGTILIPSVDVSGAAEYVVSVRATANTSGPSGLFIEGYADYPAVFDQFFDGIVTCKAIQEVSGAWQVVPGVAARFQMMIDSIKPNAGSTPFAFMRGAVS